MTFKCKMCGGALDINNNESVATCEYCETKQTVPCHDDKKKISLFERANHLRFACEFDKASGIYEAIAAEFPNEAEAYWGLILCKYGIEYIDDPLQMKKIPTCHRSSFESVMDDDNFKKVMGISNIDSRPIYQEEARQIEKLRKNIIEVSNREEPYDIFICYKETDENGERTLDSVIAQEAYNELSGLGYKVFFARITLEDKLGKEYEPYIFAALNSAKVMLVFGTSYENYNSVWVRNEWSRYLRLIEDGEKKTLIPCFKNIDAYSLPKEFSKLQSQNMEKLGAVQDLIRGIQKIIPKEKNVPNPVLQKTIAAEVTADTLLERAYIMLNDGDFDQATSYFNKVLDRAPRESKAYWGLILSTQKCIDNIELTGSRIISQYYNYTIKEKALSYSDECFDKTLEEIWGNTYKNACCFASENECQIYKSCYTKIKKRLVDILHEKQAEEERENEKLAEEAREKLRLENENKLRLETEKKKYRNRRRICTVLIIGIEIAFFIFMIYIDFLNISMQSLSSWLRINGLLIFNAFIGGIISRVGKYEIGIFFPNIVNLIFSVWIVGFIIGGLKELGIIDTIFTPRFWVIIIAQIIFFITGYLISYSLTLKNKKFQSEIS